MEWLAGAALLPLIMCGVMCVGGIALAALGFRRTQDGNAAKSPCCGPADDAASADTDTDTVEQPGHRIEA